MLNEGRLRDILPVSGLGKPLFFYEEIGSTNDIAIDLAKEGASHGTLIVAEGQTAGRGRGGRRWITVPGCGLALSIILKPSSFVDEDWIKYHALGALAIVDVLEGYGVEAEIKWPNDVLIQEKKAAGILLDLSWEGERVEFVVLGIGINIFQAPFLEEADFAIPAISIQEILREEIDWHEFLKGIVSKVGIWYTHIHQSQFIEEWDGRLAYRGERVVVSGQKGEFIGKVVGLSESGALKIMADHNLVEIQNDQTQIRLVVGE